MHENITELTHSVVFNKECNLKKKLFYLIWAKSTYSLSLFYDPNIYSMYFYIYFKYISTCSKYIYIYIQIGNDQVSDINHKGYFEVLFTDLNYNFFFKCTYFWGINPCCQSCICSNMAIKRLYANMYHQQFQCKFKVKTNCLLQIIKISI